MKTKKIGAILLAASLTVGMFAGCGSNAKSSSSKSEAATTEETKDGEESGVVWNEDLLDPENPVTVKFYSYSYASPSFGTGFQTLMDNFNNGVGKEKGVILEFVADDTGTKAETDIKAGQQVDMVQYTFPGIDGAIENMGLSAFEDVFPEEEMEAHFEGIPENCLNLGRIDGKMYGLAFTFSTPILYINGSLLEEAG